MSIRVSMNPGNTATKAAVAGASYAFTYEKLGALISDAESVASGALRVSAFGACPYPRVCAPAYPIWHSS